MISPGGTSMILYKYLTPKKATDWLIGENSILLTPPVYLNDLLEFRARREPADKQERRAMFEMFQKESPSDLSFEEFDRHMTTPHFLDGEGSYMQSGLSELLGVVSLAADPANELMWAHYGLNTGVAIGYRCSSSIEQDGLRGSALPLGLALKVEYSNDVVPIKKDFSDAAHSLTSKRVCWAHEMEWRIVAPLSDARKIKRDEKTFYALPAHREQIAHAVFGANAEPEFIRRVSKWLQESPATMQKLEIDPHTHNLVFTDLARIN
jgi:hypothetical protein